MVSAAEALPRAGVRGRAARLTCRGLTSCGAWCALAGVATASTWRPSGKRCETFGAAPKARNFAPPRRGCLLGTLPPPFLRALLTRECDQAATALKGDTSAGQAITLATVDATVERSLAEKYDIGGFPTIKIFEGNSATGPSEYEGPREADGIVSFLKVLPELTCLPATQSSA